MDYAYYLLAVLFIALLCLCSMHLAIRNGNRALASNRNGRRKADSPPAARNGWKERSAGPRSARGGLNANAFPARMPATPWGWPNHTSGRSVAEAGVGDRLRRAAVHLTKKRQLVGQAAPDPRRSRSIRALLEDRYGRVNADVMPAIKYHKVKPPRLRDPRAPHDQMDNFGTGEAARISARLQRHGVKGRVQAVPIMQRRKNLDLQLKNIKQPWGW